MLLISSAARFRAVEVLGSAVMPRASALVDSPRGVGACTAQVVSTATVGNRVIALELFNGATREQVYPASVVQAASLTVNYLWGIDLPALSVAPAGVPQQSNNSLPANLVVFNGWTIRIVDMAAIDAAGDLCSARLLMLEDMRQY